MKNQSQKTFHLASTITIITLFAWPILPALADTGLGVTGGVSGHSELSSDLPMVIGELVGVLLGVIGVLFFLLILYAGFLWMTSSGKEEQVTTARNMIFGAIIGLVIIFAAYGITTFFIQTIGMEDNGAWTIEGGGDVIDEGDSLEESMGGGSDTTEDFDALLDELAD